MSQSWANHEPINPFIYHSLPMQLFFTEFEKKNDIINIKDQEILKQMKQVLRAKTGDNFYVQNKENERYEVSLQTLQKDILEAKINNLIPQKQEKNRQATMLIAMPNKQEKIELIVQKLTEIWINNIIFWPSERSVIKSRNTNKDERLQKIAREALEQSRGRSLPKISFLTDIKNIIDKQDQEIIIFDKTEKESPRPSPSEREISPSLKDLGALHGWKGLGDEGKIAVVGPEGGLTPRDYDLFKNTKHLIHDLGDTVLRTETAAIIAWRLIKNT